MSQLAWHDAASGMSGVDGASGILVLGFRVRFLARGLGIWGGWTLTSVRARLQKIMSAPKL